MPYEASWDLPHAPGPEDIWQESDCYWFFDRSSGIGGYHRIGQCPNKGTGQVLLNLFRKGDQRFRLLGELEPGQCERTDKGQRVGSSTVVSQGDKCMQYGWDEPDCAGEVEFYESFYTPRDWVEVPADNRGASTVDEKLNSGGHLECSGRIRGTVRIGNENFTINALGHRDRSWGARDYRAAYQHRMVTGTVGPELSWATFVVRLANGITAHAGFIVRDGEAHELERVDILNEFADDGLTLANLRSRIHLKNGQTVDITGPVAEGFLALTDGWLTSSHHFVEIGESGFTVSDATNRPSMGDYVPTAGDVVAVCNQDGLSACGDYASLQFG